MNEQADNLGAPAGQTARLLVDYISQTGHRCEDAGALVGPDMIPAVEDARHGSGETPASRATSRIVTPRDLAFLRMSALE